MRIHIEVEDSTLPYRKRLEPKPCDWEGFESILSTLEPPVYVLISTSTTYAFGWLANLEHRAILDRLCLGDAAVVDVRMTGNRNFLSMEGLLQVHTGDGLNGHADPLAVRAWIHEMTHGSDSAPPNQRDTAAISADMDPYDLAFDLIKEEMACMEKEARIHRVAAPLLNLEQVELAIDRRRRHLLVRLGVLLKHPY